MENRTAVFAAQPQSVEVYQAGAWWAGELLGWRHDDSGTCQVWVRVVLGGVEETAWMDLTGLRLPERHLTVAPEPAAVPDASSTQKLPRATSPRRERPAASDTATASMPMVRDLSVVGGTNRPGGRRRAPEVPVAAATATAPRAGGRRRAPESPEMVVAAAAALSPKPSSSGGRRRAPEDSVGADATVPAPTGDAGRHRAAPPVDPGRHRKADTGLFPAVSDAPAATATAKLPARPSRLDDTFGGRSRSAWGAVGEPQPELLTRPMRLSDDVPHARRPRLDGSLTGV